MRNNRTYSIITVVLGLLWLHLSAIAQQPVKHWFKGNVHAHTVNSDGDSTPLAVAEWYREHGYNFLAITDHNWLTDTENINRVAGEAGKFLLLPGEEVTTTSVDKKEVHVNGIGINRLVPPSTGKTVIELLQQNVDAIHESGGIASLNHPNYTWAIQSKELIASRDLLLFEVFNASWSVGNAGGGGYESHEEMWDKALSAGKKIYGIASDDSHDFKQYGRALPYPPTIPGGGWIVVRAEALTQEHIVNALRRGDFYASTGVVLSDVQVDESAFTIHIRRTRDSEYRTEFIGKDGVVLSTSTDVNPSYRLRGDEVYVRARVQDSIGGVAWVQPIFPARGKAK